MLSLRIDSVSSSSSGVSPSEARSALMDPILIEHPLPRSPSSPPTDSRIAYLPSSPPASPSRSEISSKATSSVPSAPVVRSSHPTRRVRFLRPANRCRRRLYLHFPLHCRMFVHRPRLQAVVKCHHFSRLSLPRVRRLWMTLRIGEAVEIVALPSQRGRWVA